MTPRTPTIIYDETGTMELILGALNDENEVRRSEMRRLVQAWENSGRDVRKLLKTNGELGPYLYGKQGPTWRAVAIPSGSGLEISIMPEGPNDKPLTARELVIDEARLVFLRLLTHPAREKLSSNPCARCDRYYQKRTARNKVYCSRKCSKDGTAAFATKKRLEEEHAAKISRAKAAIQGWITAHTKLDWKEFVARKQPDITPKFLTRAVNKGEITAPPRKGKQP